ncbi:hypothetical protein MsAg5_14180 [Methanosarcinaceae archaeon Ag5]|uniref:Uncharacterized protein n=1 Tax=Methanolapillus africanus TaxID=3028297 RepID=A0AAE4SEE1_9EURY|nr:hypothetical protein [Methanosarcinaceae archaeon Ag5]
MKEVYFSVPETGSLYLDEVLVQIDAVALLFTCRDEQNRPYLCVCTDSYEPGYVVVLTTPEILIQMLNNEIPMYDAFLQSPDGIAFKIEEKDSLENDIVASVSIHDVSEKDLPLRNAFFEIHTKSITDYIFRLQEGFENESLDKSEGTRSNKQFAFDDQNHVKPVIYETK